MSDAPIAVFDSGLGGLSVLLALRRALPCENFLYFGDSANAPYGPLPTEKIRELTLAHAQQLFLRGAKALVVACNTATSAAVDELRAMFPTRIIIGIEPALRLAVRRHPGGSIVVMATDATLRERKFAALMQREAGAARIVKCPCPELVDFVERGELSGARVEAVLQRELSEALKPAPDAVVLGCTHFPFLSGAISRVVGPKAELLDGAQGTAEQTRRRLEQVGLLRQSGCGSVILENSNPAQNARAQALLRHFDE